MVASMHRPDFYSGLPWVYVNPQAARAHPKGKLSPLLWAIAIFFILSGLAKGAWFYSVGGGVGLALLNGGWPVLTGVGLAFRVPWAVVMAMISAALTAWSILQGGGGPTALVTLAALLINIGILFYLIDGDRPNFVYRHRYRKYSTDKGPENGVDQGGRPQ